MNKAVFFDRDGVITNFYYDLENEIINPPLNPQQVELNPHITNLLKHTKELGYLNIIISNQPDLALKKIDIKNLEAVKLKVTELLLEDGAVIDDAFYCLHHPFAKISKYKKICECRKPNTALVNEAVKKYNIDLKKSYLIGDGVNDIKAGKKMGVKTILIANSLETGYLAVIKKNLEVIEPDYIVKNLKEVQDIIAL